MSSVVGDDTVRTINEGRATAFRALSSAQDDLKKVFIPSAITFVVVFTAMRLYVWAYLKSVAKSSLDPDFRDQLNLIATTPFDVILMQVKVAGFVALFVAAIGILYYARKAILRRVTIDITPGRLYTFIVLSAGLALVGMWYAYSLFFPLMFKFLAEQAIGAGIKPSYSVVEFTNFLLLLTISFALAAQLPLVMGGISYAGIVPYEKFRDNWRYAVLGIFVFGAVFSPPDPFTQIMWAIPLMALYAFSLGISKLATNIRRANDRDTPVDQNTFQLQGYFVIAAAVGSFLVSLVALGADADVWVTETLLKPLPDTLSLVVYELSLPTQFAVGDEPGDWLLPSLRIGALVGGVTLLVVVIRVLRAPVVPPSGVAFNPDDPEEASEENGVAAMDTAELRAAPIETFTDLTEQEVTEIAGRWMDDQPERARALLDRFDEAQELEAINLAELDAAEIRDLPLAVFQLRDEDELTELASGEMPHNQEKADALFDRLEEARLARDVDFETLSTEEIRELPPEVFHDVDETDIVGLAGQWKDEQPERAQALIDRFDWASEKLADRELSEPEPAAAEAGPEPSTPEAPPDRQGNTATDPADEGAEARETAAGVVNPFTEEDLDEEDIGGYFYDIQFILSSLKSRLFVIFAVFGGTLGIAFGALYYGAIGFIVDQLVGRVPAGELSRTSGLPGTVPDGAVLPDPSAPGYAQEAAGAGASGLSDIPLVALHPVEVIVFIVKFSVVVAAAATIPVVLYYAWPAISERGFMSDAKRRTFLVWGGSLTGGMLLGTVLGILYLAPAIIGFLITDATSSGMIISYRIKSFLWVVFYLTIGIGLLANVPVTMGLFHLGNIAEFELQRKYWREITFAIFVAGWLLTPDGVFTMLLFGFSVLLAFLLGLLVLWIVTLPRDFKNRVVKAGRVALGLPRKATTLFGGRSR